MDYVVNQSRALIEAVQVEGPAGTGVRSFQLAEHLAAEGGLHRGDIMAATAFWLAVTALDAGEPEVAERFAEQMRGYGADSVELLAQTVRLETGLDQGWLPRDQFDGLIAYAEREGRADMITKARVITPRELPAVSPGGR